MTHSLKRIYHYFNEIKLSTRIDKNSKIVTTPKQIRNHCGEALT